MRVKKRLSFAERACRTFRTGSPELKKDIMMELQSQIIVKDKDIKLDLDPLLNLFFKKPNQKDLEKVLVRTKTNEMGTRIFELFFSSSSVWGRLWEEIRKSLITYYLAVHSL